MNQSQARHAKSMARHIRTHAESLVRSMEAIERENLEQVPVVTIESKFDEVPGILESIQQVLDDMYGELRSQ